MLVGPALPGASPVCGCTCQVFRGPEGPTRCFCQPVRLVLLVVDRGIGLTPRPVPCARNRFPGVLVAWQSRHLGCPLALSASAGFSCSSAPVPSFPRFPFLFPRRVPVPQLRYPCFPPANPFPGQFPVFRPQFPVLPVHLDRFPGHLPFNRGGLRSFKVSSSVSQEGSVLRLGFQVSPWPSPLLGDVPVIQGKFPVPSFQFGFSGFPLAFAGYLRRLPYLFPERGSVPQFLLPGFPLAVLGSQRVLFHNFRFWVSPWR